METKPSKIVWDVPWGELLALELAKAGYRKPSHLIIHLKNFKRSENFVRLIKCNVDEEEEQDPQAVVICSSIRRAWKSHQSVMKVLTLKVIWNLHSFFRLKFTLIFGKLLICYFHWAGSFEPATRTVCMGWIRGKGCL